MREWGGDVEMIYKTYIISETLPSFWTDCR